MAGGLLKGLLMMTLEQLRDLAGTLGFRLYHIAELDHGVLRTAEGEPANACQNSYSVAKAFTMTAIGMLCDRGLLRVEDRVYPLFEREFPADHDPNWEKVTVEHALTHRVGFREGFLDIDVEDVSSYGTDDYLSVVLRHPVEYEPGTREVYSDAAFYLLSRVVAKVSGERLDDFLMHELFTPLGFQEVAWSHCPHGHAMGATGLYIRSQDMVKLGEVYRTGGLWQGRRILSEDWVAQTLRKGYELRPTGKGYGKGGMLGQMLFVLPGQERVLAWHGHGEDEAVRFFHAVVDNA